MKEIGKTLNENGEIVSVYERQDKTRTKFKDLEVQEAHIEEALVGLL